LIGVVHISFFIVSSKNVNK